MELSRRERSSMMMRHEEDQDHQSAEENENFQQLGATLVASKFAKNTKTGGVSHLKTKRGEGISVASLKMPKFFKPDEPDFSLSLGEDDGNNDDDDDDKQGFLH